ncbi:MULTISPECIES: D-aminoacyl-tRNA deacylase [Anaerotruncus]|jgi:D-tyrosyl-tRNA(Tyr) deacylase|uniref:D-aminoacyl-tRNA deacylase n=1 Tax=Anaerotruncus TaxID=244127 RepID=UPI0008346522|nr:MULTISPECIES: D-aminoacyl-tRNA deacylase [Anaerotruncus]RGX56657.1 D-tyrosyl-tRNA(Tyr) deacylase [Anaerotruncus sp. AF02-27]
MKAVLQRVKSAKVTIAGETVGEIGQGLAILLGVVDGDGVDEADFLAEKTANLRIFEDENGKLNRSLLDIGGGMLVVSNFTLCADARHGRRPSFTNAARPETANSLYERFVAAAKDAGAGLVQTGSFGADMLVSIENDGPVTIILDTNEIMKK